MDVISMFVPAVFGRESHASVELVFKIPPEYPREAQDCFLSSMFSPIVIVSDAKGLSVDDVLDLGSVDVVQELLLKKDIMIKSNELAKKGDIFLFDLIMYTQDFLQAHNDEEVVQSVCFEEQMRLAKEQEGIRLSRSDSNSRSISKDLGKANTANLVYMLLSW